ncbi:MAG TPA: PLP-dependent aspartate aminotransferase family protein, partial [Flavisolibacter sp.]|nr:PLP-dependent aspartate aminotransferase family protein [Flavisolibacter sp.]
AEAERKIAGLETFGLNVDAKAILHSSGMSAISTLFLSLLKSGDKVLSHYSLYGGTSELLAKVLPEMGIQAVITNLRNPENAEEALKKDKAIKLLYIETPANPTIQCVDIAALTSIAKKYNVLVAADNTFASPYLQQPFRFGVDYIIHSTTKFLNGHGTAIGGVLLGRDIEFMNTKATKVHRLLGGNSNPFDAFLLVNGIKTLELRMERHCANAEAVAIYLEKHKSISNVLYAGSPNHPDYKVASRQMKKGGGMLSFELKDGLEGGIKFMDKLKMCLRTVSLGTVDTLLCQPASMTHYGVPKAEREQYGITDGLIRMNVGIENIEDILADLEQALK